VAPLACTEPLRRPQVLHRAAVRWRLVRTAAFLLALLGLAGCSLTGGDEASIERSELEQLVLQPDDLQRAFVRFGEGHQVLADSPGGGRADPARFGRVEGWIARYRRPGAAQAAGPQVIVSRADLFGSVTGAEDDFEAARAELANGGLGWSPIDEPGLGDESFAATVVQTGGIRYYQVFWRDDNATATLDVNGFEGKVALEDVLELARKQQGRIARASGS
jgi:hypothetical protein